MDILKKLVSLGAFSGTIMVTQQDETGKEYTKQYEIKSDCKRFNENREFLKSQATILYKNRKEYVNKLISIEKDIKGIKNLPSWVSDDYRKALEQIVDFRTVVEYENSPKEYVALTDKIGRTKSSDTFYSAIKELGSVATMAIATVVGTIATGTAISALSNSAATNAALAWLSGGRAAAGGVRTSTDNGGLLDFGLFGLLGGSIASIAAGSIFNYIVKNTDRQNVKDNIDAIRQENRNLEPKLKHLSELIIRSNNFFQNRLCKSIEWLNVVSPKDYKQWDDTQKHELEKLINAVSNMTQLINERV